VAIGWQSISGNQPKGRGRKILVLYGPGLPKNPGWLLRLAKQYPDKRDPPFGRIDTSPRHHIAAKRHRPRLGIEYMKIATITKPSQGF